MKWGAQRKFSVTWVCLNLLLCGLPNCAVHRQALQWTYPAANSAPRPFSSEMDRWMRHGQIRQRFLTVLDVQAVLKSWTVRESWITHVQARKGLETSERNRLRQQEVSDHSVNYEFLLSVFSDQKELHELNHGRGPWFITLENEAGVSVRPLTIEEYVPEPGLIWDFHPARTPWSRNYTVRFPIENSEGTPLLSGVGRHELTLHFRSVAAHLRLNWKLYTE